MSMPSLSLALKNKEQKVCQHLCIVNQIFVLTLSYAGEDMDDFFKVG